MSEFDLGDGGEVYRQGEEALVEYTQLLMGRGATYGPSIPVNTPREAVLHLHESNQRAANGEQVFDAEQADVLSRGLPTPQGHAAIGAALASPEMQQQGLVGYPSAEAFVGQVLESTRQVETPTQETTYDPNSRIARLLNGEDERTTDQPQVRAAAEQLATGRPAQQNPSYEELARALGGEPTPRSQPEPRGPSHEEFAAALGDEPTPRSQPEPRGPSHEEFAAALGDEPTPRSQPEPRSPSHEEFAAALGDEP
ncbi:MAG: hypothetical protein GEV07_29915, partial [Streptosporangiales bacterium]|nr:hypothetical protein [Streptosporangiales bacterium]